MSPRRRMTRDRAESLIRNLEVKERIREQKEEKLEGELSDWLDDFKQQIEQEKYSKDA